MAFTAGLFALTPMVVRNGTVTITQAELEVQVASAGAETARAAIYQASNSWQPGTLVADLGTVSTQTTGRKTITGLSVALTSGYYLARIHTEATCQLRAHYGTCPDWSNHPNSANHPYTTLTGTVTYAAAETPGTAATTGVSNSTGPYSFLTFLW